MTKVSSGQTVVLMCVTDVSPDRIVWIKDGDEIVLREQNTLTLPDVQPSNSGMYVCEIVGTGVTSASFNLMVPEIGEVKVQSLSVCVLSLNLNKENHASIVIGTCFQIL